MLGVPGGTSGAPPPFPGRGRFWASFVYGPSLKKDSSPIDDICRVSPALTTSRPPSVTSRPNSRLADGNASVVRNAIRPNCCRPIMLNSSRTYNRAARKRLTRSRKCALCLSTVGPQYFLG